MSAMRNGPWLWAAVVASACMLSGCEPAGTKTGGKDTQKAPASAPTPTPKAGAAADVPVPTAPAGLPADKSGQIIAQKVPLGLPELPAVADNLTTPDKIELGKMLYFDKRVSKDNSVSCATCHDPKMAWAEHEPVSTGIRGQKGGRNSPSIINAAYATSQFWDGRAGSLEEQAGGPVANPIEMGHTMEQMVATFKKIPAYEERFQKVFGHGMTEKAFTQAIAAFERTILSGDSPYDRYVKNNEKGALNEAQKRGLQKFNDVCSTCHTPPLFSNYNFYNVGIGMDKPKPDEGRKDVTKEASDLGKFRVPALREVANTYPYFHDGSVAKLEDAVSIMADGGKDNKNLSAAVKMIRGAKLTADDKKDLVEFLKALSGKYPIIEPPQLP